MTKTYPIALLSSDLHFCSTAPSARSAESNWFETMRGYIEQVRRLIGELDVPWIVAGDIFDRWNSSPELINFLLDELPFFYAICGQHDLPWHQHEDMGRSAFGTLLRAEKIQYIPPGDRPFEIREKLSVWSFPWGFDVKPCPVQAAGRRIKLAIVHAYIWKDGYGYPGADPEKRISIWRKKLDGYDCALFGDNHKGFLTGVPGEFQLLNGGTFYRRKTDERGYKPHAGILYSDGRIELHYWDTSKDKWLEDERAAVPKIDTDASEFILSLRELGSDALDFRTAVNCCMDAEDTPADVRKIVMESMP